MNQHTKGYFKAFLLSFITGLLFIIPFTLLGKGVYYLGSDFVEQQIPFAAYCINAVKNGSVLWAPALDLGASFIGAFSFYGIGSPFFWLSLLVSADKYYLFAGIFLALKMGAAGLCAFAYIKQYVKNESWAVSAGIMYAFCGYQISNMNFHFYDITALFPLLLLCLDAAVLRNKKGVFAIAVALLALCSPVFFVGEVVFLILYFIVKAACKEYKLTVKKFIGLAVESLIGVGISAFLVLPTVLSLLNNPRVENAGFTSLAQMLFLKPIYWAEIVRSSLFPAECIFERGFYLQGFTNGAELYLPLFGIVLAVAFCFANKKSWITRLLIVCGVFAAVPILNSAFVMFNAEYYTRWYYMPLLIMCAASAVALDKKEISLKSGFIAYGAMWGALLIVYLAFTYYFKVTFIYNLVPVAFFAAISLAGFAFTIFVRKIQTKKQGAAIIMAAVMAISALCGGFNTYYHHKQRSAQIVSDYYNSNKLVALPEDAQQYRIFSQYYFMNLGTYLNQPTVSSFSSSITPSVFEFYKACEMPRSVITMAGEEQKGFLSLLSAKYWVYYTQEKGSEYMVKEYESALPMGFGFDYYITPQQFEALNKQQKDYALVKAVILDKETADALGKVIAPLPKEMLAALDDTAFAQDIENRKSSGSSSFSYTNKGANAEISLEKDSLVFFSIPYDEGWSVKVNGEAANLIKADYAFYAVSCKEGENTIEFSYMPKGLPLGLAISALSLAAFAVYFGCNIKKRTKASDIKSADKALGQ